MHQGRCGTPRLVVVRRGDRHAKTVRYAHHPPTEGWPVTETPRPTPLRGIAVHWAQVMGALNGLVTSGAAVGLLSTDQVSALEVALSAVLGVTAAGITVLGTFRVAIEGQDVVTPLSDPRDYDGTELIPRGIGSSGHDSNDVTGP